VIPKYENKKQTKKYTKEQQLNQVREEERRSASLNLHS